MKLMNSGNLLSNRIRISALLLALMLLLLTGCSSTGPAETGALTESGSAEETTLPTVTEPASKNEASEPYSTKSSLPEGTDRMFYAHVNGKVLKILAAENSSADAFLDLLKSGDVPVEMHDYGSFEKVGPLGTTLPRNDEQITTEPGDVILYQGDQITIYYDVNNWSFTRRGKVRDLSQAELKDILGSGNVTVTFSLSEGRMEPESSKVLVVIFSRTGHTKPLAEYIAEDLNADLYEIEAKVPYTDDDIKYYTNCRADREQNDPSARPEIAGELPDVTGYDTVFLGYPIWHGHAPKIIYTFLEGVQIRPEDQECFDRLPQSVSWLYLGIGGILSAAIGISDPLRPEARLAVEALHAEGIEKAVMLTGDNRRVAGAIAGQLGIDEYRAEVLPEDKAAFIKAEHESGRCVIMIGDGINDTPALSLADVGIAVGSGAVIAREVADVTIAAEDLRELVWLKRLSDSLMHRINRNYRFVMGFNSALILLGALGLLAPSASALLHNASTILLSMDCLTELLSNEEDGYL